MRHDPTQPLSILQTALHHTSPCWWHPQVVQHAQHWLHTQTCCPARPLPCTPGCSSTTHSLLVRSQVLHSLGNGSKPLSLPPLAAPSGTTPSRRVHVRLRVSTPFSIGCAHSCMSNTGHAAQHAPAPDRALSALIARRPCQVAGSPGAAAGPGSPRGWAHRPASLAAPGYRPAAAAGPPPALRAAPRCLGPLQLPPSAGSARTGPQ